MFDDHAVARLDLVRTLRDLGLDLPTIRRVVDREVSLHQVAVAHAEAIAAQIRILRLRHAVLAAAIDHGSTAEQLDRMHRLARLSEAGRRCLIDDFLATVFDDGRADPALAGVMRSMTPELPDHPSSDQIEAWVGLALLVQDADFVAGWRRVAEHFVAERAGDRAAIRRDIIATIRDRVGPMLAGGVDPHAPAARELVAAVLDGYADAFDRPGDIDLRRQLSAHIEAVNDPRRERYFQLLSVINGWSEPETMAPALDWFAQALRFPGVRS
jgi:DNA-binding transcriptional MerR regulator